MNIYFGGIHKCSCSVTFPFVYMFSDSWRSTILMLVICLFAVYAHGTHFHHWRWKKWHLL